MSKYSIIIGGKVEDLTYKKLNNFSYSFYVGETLIGSVFRLQNNYWSCTSQKPHELCPVHGFRNRHSASEFLLKLNGLDKKEETDENN